MYAGIADRMQKEITALAPSSKFHQCDLFICFVTIFICSKIF